MKRITIYHGSNHIIEKPSFGVGDAHNDYGLGFYCTVDLNMAKEWANRNVAGGFVNKYVFDMRGLKILDLTNGQYSVFNWIAILMHFRKLSAGQKEMYQRRLMFLEKHFYIDVKEYDVVIGYRADDAYFKFPLFFLQNELSVDRLEEIYKLGNLGKQVALISEKAFSHLKYVTSFEAEAIYHEHYQSRKNNADARFESIRIEEINDISKPKLEDLMKYYD